MNKRIDWRIELLNVLLIIFGSNKLELIIVNSSIYLLLTLTFYYSVSPKFIFKEIKETSSLGERVKLSDDKKNNFVKKGIAYLSSSKTFILLIPIITNNSIFQISMISSLIFTFLFLCITIIIFSFSMNNFIKANGFINAKVASSFFYYNPDDKRAMIDKRVGVGSELNFGSKQGRLVLWVLLAIPVTVITLLLIAFALAGKL